VQRRVSSRGGIQVARQRIQVGMTHAGKIVTVVTETNSFRLVIDAETVAVVPRTTSSEIRRYKAYAARNHPADPAPAKEATPCPR
jgi:cytidine deaminase